jgi:nitrite reductase/ring-hydroxylating ferredoxin subunit
MSLIKITDLANVPEEGTGITLAFDHPYTEMPYELGLFCIEGKYYAITNKCTICEGRLAPGKLIGMFAACNKRECFWNVKKGYCKFDRTTILPTYKVLPQEDGLYINI